jgi:hypothetical protein
MHVDVADLSALRTNERVEAIDDGVADDAFDAHLDDAILSCVETGHLQIDERERRLAEGEIPRCTRRRDRVVFQRSTVMAMP